MLKTINTIITQIARSLQSNTSTGLMQITGPAAGATRTVTIPDANSTMARTDAAQSFTGDQTLATGNLVIGTAGKGIDFSANSHAAGMTSELLNWYEEGAFTPTLLSGGLQVSRTYSVQYGRYTRIGNRVFFLAYITLSAKGSSTGVTQIGGLPFTSSATDNDTIVTSANGFVTYTGSITPYIGSGQTVINIYASSSASNLTFLTDTALANNSSFWLTGQYKI